VPSFVIIADPRESIIRYRFAIVPACFLISARTTFRADLSMMQEAGLAASPTKKNHYRLVPEKNQRSLELLRNRRSATSNSRAARPFGTLRFPTGSQVYAYVAVNGSSVRARRRRARPTRSAWRDLFGMLRARRNRHRHARDTRRNTGTWNFRDNARTGDAYLFTRCMHAATSLRGEEFVEPERERSQQLGHPRVRPAIPRTIINIVCVCVYIYIYIYIYIY